MPKSWQQAYADLTDYITQHPQIEIQHDSVKIPEEVRPRFYELFDAARDAYIEEKLADVLNQARVVSQKYAEAELKVKSLLELDSIRVKKPFYWFIPEPLNGLRMGLFELLFDRLKGKINQTAFDYAAELIIQRALVDLFYQAYEKWIALSLIPLLSADDLFHTFLHQVDRSQVMEIETPGTAEEIPSPQHSDIMTFEHLGYILFTIPDYIVHSKVLGKYVSIRTAIDKPIAVGSNRSDKREWYPWTAAAALAPGLMPLYLADNPDDLSIVADRENFCRPDLLIECRSNPNWQNSDSLEVIKYHHDVLKPKLGTVIIVREPETEPHFTVVGDNTYLLRAGFNTSKLKPVIDLLMKEAKG